MNCKKCGKEIKEKNTFCTHCGWCKDDVLRKKLMMKRIIILSSLVVLCFAAVITFFLIQDSKIISAKNIRLVSDYDSDTLVDDIVSIEFGHFPISDRSAKELEPIEWIVLDRDKKNRRALLLSKYILDSGSCNMLNENKPGWSSCLVRAWLNANFYELAFSEEEKKKIVEIELENADNEDYDTLGGINTNDKLFLLSIDEMRKYFKSGKKEVYRDQLGKYAATRGSEFAKKGAKTDYNKRVNNLDYLGKDDREVNVIDDKKKEWAAGFSDYWLRSPGGEQKVAACVRADAYLDTGGRGVYSNMVGIRPAMWISY